MLQVKGMSARRIYHIGLDVHLRTSTCCILDEQGQQIKLETIRGHWSLMIEALRKLPGKLIVGYEASCAYGMLHDQLADFCQEVQVGHPGHLRLIFIAKRKNDRIDAAKIAKLVYLQQFPKIHVPSPEVRAWRELIELRHWLMRQISRVKNGLKALLRTYGVQVPEEESLLWTRHGRAWLGALTWPMPEAALHGQVLLAQWDHLAQQVEVVTERLDQIAKAHSGVALLCTIPGVGMRTAEAMIAYIDDAQRFSRINQVAAYAGLVPCEDSSADAKRLGHITKAGPATMRWLLVQSSWQVIRRQPAMKAYYQRICVRRGQEGKIAIVAVARKLLSCMLAMLRSGETWRTPETPAAKEKGAAHDTKPAATPVTAGMDK